MMLASLTIASSPLAAAALLYRLWLRPRSLLLYGAILLPFAVVSAYQRDPMPIALVAILLIVFAAVLCRFLTQEFAAEDAPPAAHAPDMECLSFDILVRLVDLDDIRLPAIVAAALASPRGKYLLEEARIDPRRILDRLDELVQRGEDLDTRAFLAVARSALPDVQRARISSSVVLFALFTQCPHLRDILDDADLSLEDLKHLVQWGRLHTQWRTPESILSPRWILRNIGGIGRSWVEGYTDKLDFLTEDIGPRILHTRPPVAVIHVAEATAILHALTDAANHNALVVGRSGCGKTALVEAVVRMLRQEESAQHRDFARVLMLRTEQVLSGTRAPDQFLLAALARAEHSGRFILVIPHFATLLKGASEQLKGVLLRLLQERDIAVLAIAEPRELATIRSDPALESLFETVPLAEPPDAETMSVLLEHSFRLRKQSRVVIPYRVLRLLLRLTARYVGGQAFPGKAITILDEAIAIARRARDSILRDEHVREVVSLRSHIDVRVLARNEGERLARLEAVLRASIVGQDHAVTALILALKRARAEVAQGNHPVGTFLFLGPTGVGKTHTALVLAREYIGTEENLLRLDMNEFSTEAAVVQIEDVLARRVQERPASLVLLDEVEKAHPKILHLFLQILDEGALHNADGDTTDFRNTIVIATSNAGAAFVYELLRSGNTADLPGMRKTIIDRLIAQQCFSPEFLNRFDEVVVYAPLTTQASACVCQLLLENLAKKIVDERGIAVSFDPALVAELVDRGTSAEFGAREMRRLIADTVEVFLADAFLRGALKRGDSLTVRLQDVKF